MAPVLGQAVFLGDSLEPCLSDSHLHVDVAFATARVVLPQRAQRLLHTTLAFSPSCEDVAEVDDFVTRVVFCDSHGPSFPKAAQSLFKGPQSPFLEVLIVPAIHRGFTLIPFWHKTLQTHTVACRLCRKGARTLCSADKRLATANGGTGLTLSPRSAGDCERSSGKPRTAILPVRRPVAFLAPN